MEYQTCFHVIVDDSTQNTEDPLNPVLPKKGYFLHIKLMTNFLHKIAQTVNNLENQNKKVHYG